MELITIFIIIAIISKVLKKAQESSESVVGKTQNAWDDTVYQSPKKGNAASSESVKTKQLSRQEIQAQIEKTKQRIKESKGMTEPAGERTENEHFQQANMHRQQENREAMQQVYASRMEAKNTTILQRAKANAQEDMVDVTLETMEAEHNHSERVSPAEHHHPEDVMPESMLGSIEDLMIKGYDGNLCFERDFVGEAMDMISRFTVPSDVLDFSNDDVA